MKQKSNKFSVISEIYSHFTKENKENLIKTATSLLKVQKDDAEILGDASLPKNESEKQA